MGTPFSGSDRGNAVGSGVASNAIRATGPTLWWLWARKWSGQENTGGSGEIRCRRMIKASIQGVQREISHLREERCVVKGCGQWPHTNKTCPIYPSTFRSGNRVTTPFSRSPRLSGFTLENHDSSNPCRHETLNLPSAVSQSLCRSGRQPSRRQREELPLPLHCSGRPWNGARLSKLKRMPTLKRS